MDLHSLLIAESASSNGGTLNLARGGVRMIRVPDFPVTLEIAVGGAVVGEWSEVAGGAKPRIDFDLLGPTGQPAGPGSTVTITAPAQSHPDEPLVLPFGFVAAFAVAAEGRHLLSASVNGQVLKRVPIAILGPVAEETAESDETAEVTETEE